MDNSRRRFLKMSAATFAAAGVGVSFPSKAHAGLGVMLGVLALSQTIVSMTGRPFRANPAIQERKADPYMVILEENRNLLGVVHSRLDSVSAALNAIMLEQNLLPDRIDQIVADQIRSLVPDIVAEELGNYRNEQYATDLHASLSTFVEEVRLGIPIDRLSTRLDQIRHFRNRVIASSGYSALTLCAAMETEMAAMKVLNFSRSQAIVVANVYRKEFVRKYKELGLVYEDSNTEWRRITFEDQPDHVKVVAQKFVWRRPDGKTCDATPSIEFESHAFPVSEGLGDHHRFDEMVVTRQPDLRMNSPCNRTVTCGGGCYEDVSRLAALQSAWIADVSKYNDRQNSLLGIRASMAEMMHTISATNNRLGVEIDQWDT